MSCVDASPISARSLLTRAQLLLVASCIGYLDVTYLCIWNQWEHDLGASTVPGARRIHSDLDWCTAQPNLDSNWKYLPASGFLSINQGGGAVGF